LNSEGGIVAVGAYANNENGDLSGHTRVFQWDGSSWKQMGRDIDGESAYDRSGSSVSLSSDGLTITIEAEDNGKSGQCSIFRWIGSDWHLVERGIEGEGYGDWFGNVVSLSSSGDKVAIAGYGGSGMDGRNTGYVKVYQVPMY